MSWRGFVTGSVLVADLIVTVHPGADLDNVADQLAKAGLQVQDKLHALGSITGSVARLDHGRIGKVIRQRRSHRECDSLRYWKSGRCQVPSSRVFIGGEFHHLDVGPEQSSAAPVNR